MEKINFLLIAKHVPLNIILCGAYIFLIIRYEKIKITKAFFIFLVLICATIVELVSILHEIGHILVGEWFNFTVLSFNFNLLDYSVILEPPIYKANGWVQMAIAIAGPAVSSTIALLLLALMKIFHNKFVVMVLLNLFCATVIGGALSLFLPFSGDCRNFFQGLAKVLGTSLTPMVILDSILLFITTVATIIKICRIINEF